MVFQGNIYFKPSYKFEISNTMFMMHEMITRNSSITFKTMTIDNNTLFSALHETQPRKMNESSNNKREIKGMYTIFVLLLHKLLS